MPIAAPGLQTTRLPPRRRRDGGISGGARTVSSERTEPERLRVGERMYAEARTERTVARG